MLETNCDYFRAALDTLINVTNNARQTQAWVYRTESRGLSDQVRVPPTVGPTTPWRAGWRGHRPVKASRLVRRPVGPLLRARGSRRAATPWSAVESLDGAAVHALVVCAIGPGASFLSRGQ